MSVRLFLDLMLTEPGQSSRFPSPTAYVFPPPEAAPAQPAPTY